MQIWQNIWSADKGWHDPADVHIEPQLVLVFAARELLDDSRAYEVVAQRFPSADIAVCSTAGEIFDTRVLDDTLTATAIRFEQTRISTLQTQLTDSSDCRDAGRRLGRELNGADLVHVLVLSDGLEVNGSELAAGINEEVPDSTTVTGGLAGDAHRFERTLVGLNGDHAAGNIVAIGFYGSNLHIGHGSLGGWDPFGPDRLITKSSGNKLFELDGRSALQLYREYLGGYATQLPASGLLFPLLVHCGGDDRGLVRTVLAIDDGEQSMTFAGDVPEGGYARLMKANFDRLIDGANGAATACKPIGEGIPPDLAILISCVGRKLVLQQRIEEEVESVRQVLGDKPAFTGFYSYGELSPVVNTTKCELHNQTMTVTTFTELTDA